MALVPQNNNNALIPNNALVLRNNRNPPNPPPPNNFINNNNNNMMWLDPHVYLLLSERQRLNYEFHYGQYRRAQSHLWNGIAATINLAFRTNYTGTQCHNKFQNLVREYHVSKKYYNRIYIQYI